MKKNLPLLFIFIAVIALLFSAFNRSKPKIVPMVTKFDFGDVVSGQILIKEIEIKNAGNGTLVIEGVSTSCGCTTAEVSQSQIKSGQSATLTIQFDSGAHGPKETGEVSRLIFIASNDPQNPELVIEFNANILPPS